MLYGTMLFVVAATIQLGPAFAAPGWPAFSVGSASGRPILNFLHSRLEKPRSLDAFQLPGLVADAMKAVDDLGVGAELQLVFNLLRINYTITQCTQLAVACTGPQIFLWCAR